MKNEVNFENQWTPEEQKEWDHWWNDTGPGTNDYHWKVELPEGIQQRKAAAESEWSKRQLTWAWIWGDTWSNPGLQLWRLLEDPPRQPCRRIVRLSLLGGGQLRVIEKFVDRDGQVWPVHDRIYPNLWTKAYLRATTELDGHLHRYRGTVQCTENWEYIVDAVVFDHGTPQGVADRSVKILELIYEAENFHALLDGRGRCAFCRHPLRDPISKLVSVGPDCAKQHEIPHTLAAATKRLALRKKLLAEMEGGQ